LDKSFIVNKTYLNPELTLTDLAKGIGVNSKILSHVINEYYKQNFFDVINHLRIEDAKKSADRRFSREKRS